MWHHGTANGIIISSLSALFHRTRAIQFASLPLTNHLYVEEVVDLDKIVLLPEKAVSEGPIGACKPLGSENPSLSLGPISRRYTPRTADWDLDPVFTSRRHICKT